MTRDWSAIILAGGKGSRLMPLTSEIPKPLVKVTNKPMVDYSIAHLIYADIKYIVLALAYMGDKMADYLKKTCGENLASILKDTTSVIRRKFRGNLGRLINNRRNNWVDEVAKKAIRKQKPSLEGFSERFAHLCRHPVLGLPILGFFLITTYFLVVHVAGFLFNILNQ